MNTPESGAAGRVGLHNIAPAPGSRRPRKRIGRGEGSGTGKTSGRGQKGAGVEALLERRDVDGLRVRPERLERHRLLHVRAAQLPHPHVNGVLATLEPGPRLGTRA